MGWAMLLAPNLRLDAALQYAARGWRILPLHGIICSDPAADSPTRNYCTCQKSINCTTPGKHPRIKTGRGYAAATTDEATIAGWWRRWPNSNVGIATGNDLCVIDIDGRAGIETLQRAMQELKLATLPRTLQATSGRPDGGIHLYYLSTICPQSSGDGLDSRGYGGLVVAPPSIHVTGTTYQWIDSLAVLAHIPVELQAWLGARAPRKRATTSASAPQNGPLGPLPAHLAKTAPSQKTAQRLRQALHTPTPPADIAAALAGIPNEDLGWDAWNRIGMAAYASDPGEESFDAFVQFSGKSRKFDALACEERWRAYAGCPPSDLSFGSLYHLAKSESPEWEPPSHTRRTASPAEVDGPLALPDAQGDALDRPVDPPKINGNHTKLPDQLTAQTPANPLIELNSKYAVIGDIGGRCMVLGWVPSKVDSSIKAPSFQSFTSFRERYSSQYLVTDEKPKQIGDYWLRWTGRRSYEGIDLEPGAPAVLPGNTLNLWSGFAVQPAAGSWQMMQDHITHVLAGDDPAYATYIFRWMAWSVQNPGERAEVALVLRGGKGAGKGRFAYAMKKLFGQHGLQIFNSKHLVGSFNGHLRNCLLLFVDEAFWAGDKQGESVLKGLITEPALMIEQKGIDASPWRNRLHVIMAANAEWVVPASADERRYAVFDVADTRIDDRAYFNAMEKQLSNGGLPAMLHDLLQVRLDGWHPRELIKTKALQGQKARSLDTKAEWLEQLLHSAEIPQLTNQERTCQAQVLLNQLREAGGRRGGEITANAMGRFLKTWGCVSVHRSTGQAWKFPPLTDIRAQWCEKYGVWAWENPVEKWNSR